VGQQEAQLSLGGLTISEIQWRLPVGWNLSLKIAAKLTAYRYRKLSSPYSTVQLPTPCGHPRSMIFMSCERACATSCYWLIATLALSFSAFEIRLVINWKMHVFLTFLHWTPNFKMFSLHWTTALVLKLCTWISITIC